MATKTPAEKAIADVEKAIKAADTAAEKHEAAQAKADELFATANRAEKTLKWTASHPDLPDDFDLDEFRRSLEAPFDEPEDDDVDPVEPDEGEVEAVREAQAELEDGDDAEDDDDDDPFADAA